MSERLMVTVKEAAEILSLGESSVYLLAAQGRLEKRYIGKGTREFRIPVESLRRFVDELPTEREVSA